MLALDGAHWTFALAVYARPGVADCCIELQNRHDVDVNVLLISLYVHTVLQRPMNISTICTLDSAGREIREMAVLPLRSVRRAMKGQTNDARFEAIRSEVKALELKAEQLEQSLIAERGHTCGVADSRMDENALVLEIVRFYDPAFTAVSSHDHNASAAATTVARAAVRVASRSLST